MNTKLILNFKSEDAAQRGFYILNTCFKKILAECDFVNSAKLNGSTFTAEGALADIDEDIDESFFVSIIDILSCNLPKEIITGSFNIQSKTIRESNSFLRIANNKFAIVSDEFDFENDHVIVGFAGDPHEKSDKDWEPAAYDDMVEFSIDYYLLFEEDDIDFDNDEFDKYLIPQKELSEIEFVYEEDEDDEDLEVEEEDLTEEEAEQYVSELFQNDDESEGE